MTSRELPLPDDATVATVQKRQSGDADQTEQERFATLVVYVSNAFHSLEAANAIIDYAKLTRKMGNKSSTSGSNLRPKEASPGLAQ